jgi:cobyrinic acid a,c-diamide synthase
MIVPMYDRNSELEQIPRIVIAAHKGGAGKTFLSVGIVAALAARGLHTAAFKKGPDYIDAGWLGLAAGGDCYNLDSFLFDKETVVDSFLSRAAGKDVAIVEGNRGLFDGVDADGNYSTAELAKLLAAPVILVIDATKMTRTAAALVAGCRVLDPAVDLKGVILNRVGGARHEDVLRDSIEKATATPVIGSVRKLIAKRFPQRHLGLLPWREHPDALDFVREAAQVAEKYVDLDRLLQLAGSPTSPDITLATLEPAAPVEETLSNDSRAPLSIRAGSRLTALPEDERASASSESLPVRGLTIGVLRDSAFHFYYPENIEALVKRGAAVVEISALDAGQFPPIDGLYIGGGFPETHAERLASNHGFKESLRRAIAVGLPVYAECGGLMYLSKSLVIDGTAYPMVGALPVETALETMPQGHGYMRVEVVAPNPFYPVGSILTGHEFHYSRVVELDQAEVSCVFRVTRGQGLDGVNDGLTLGNVLATYLHVHALGSPEWAEGILSRSAAFRRISRLKSENGS